MPNFLFSFSFPPCLNSSPFPFLPIYLYSDIRCPWGPQDDKEEAAIAKEEVLNFFLSPSCPFSDQFLFAQMNPFSRAKREMNQKKNANLTEDERKAAELRLEREATRKAGQRKEQMSLAVGTHSQAGSFSSLTPPLLFHLLPFL